MRAKRSGFLRDLGAREQLGQCQKAPAGTEGCCPSWLDSRTPLGRVALNQWLCRESVNRGLVVAPLCQRKSVNFKLE